MKFLFIFLIPLFLFANVTPIDNTNIKIYKNTYILDKDLTISEVINNDQFSIIPNLYVLLNNKFSYNYWIKIPIENTTNQDIDKSLLAFWKNTSIKIYYQYDSKLIGPHNIKEKNSGGINVDHFTLRAKSKMNIFIKVLDNSLIDDFSLLYIINQNDLYGILSTHQRFFSDSFFLGMLIMIFFSGLILYFATGLKSYLLYVVFLISTILVSTNVRWLLFPFFQNELKQIFLIFMHSFTISFVLISLSLFTKEFLELKKYYKRTNTLINFYIISVVIMFIIELTVAKNSIIPFYPVLFLLIFPLIGGYTYRKHGMPAILYTISILIYIFPFFLQASIRVFHLEINQTLSINMQISSTIASMILSIATLLKLRMIIQERREFEQQAHVRSKFSAMGEMIGNIAHQWRQPLSHLASIFINLELCNKGGKLTTLFLEEKTKEANLQLKHMSQTIEDFKNFFSKNKEKHKFNLSEIVDDSLKFMSVSLINNNIKTSVEIIKDQQINTYHNELLQVLVTIITNAKDILKEKNENERQISLQVTNNIITISDNGGGIKREVLNKIFNPYFTTKAHKHGTGLGLYMAKTIMEKNIKGKIYVENTHEGAKFTLEFTKS